MKEEQKTVAALVRALEFFSNGKKSFARAIVYKNGLHKSPFLRAHLIPGFSTLRKNILFSNPGHYGEFWLVGRKRLTKATKAPQIRLSALIALSTHVARRGE